MYLYAEVHTVMLLSYDAELHTVMLSFRYGMSGDQYGVGGAAYCALGQKYGRPCVECGYLPLG